MTAKTIYAALEEIRAMTEQYADADGNIHADEIRIRVALEFCATEVKKALEKGKSQPPCDESCPGAAMKK